MESFSKDWTNKCKIQTMISFFMELSSSIVFFVRVNVHVAATKAP